MCACVSYLPVLKNDLKKITTAEINEKENHKRIVYFSEIDFLLELFFIGGAQFTLLVSRKTQRGPNES